VGSVEIGEELRPLAISDSQPGWKGRSACIREAISQVLSRHGDAAEPRRQ